MPIFDYWCKCGAVRKDQLVTQSEIVHCTCGKEMTKFPPRTIGRLARWMTDSALDMRARNRAQFIDKPETQAKLKSGEYEIAANDDDSAYTAA